MTIFPVTVDATFMTATSACKPVQYLLPTLLGRTALRGQYLVDPGRSYLVGKRRNKLNGSSTAAQLTAQCTASNKL